MILLGYNICVISNSIIGYVREGKLDKKLKLTKQQTITSLYPNPHGCAPPHLLAAAIVFT